MNKSPLFLFLITCLFSGCGAYFNQPVGVQKAVFGENTPATISLTEMPKPKEQIVVGVYKFKDQTGQYKPTELGSTFSTAVTQGATSILIKALEDSKWFVPIERENLGNLLNERNIIRSTRQEYSKGDANEAVLTPLLFAGVLLEGGIISYDTNIITGGFGARYFGAGGSTRYRQDRVTVYLRLVSTSNGKILNTVYVSKTILSQSIDASLFRYVNLNRLLEVETGFTRNEPIQLAVTEAIEKAVEGLIVDGIKDKLWEVNAPQKQIDTFIAEYDKEKSEADLAQLYNRNLTEKRARFGIEMTGGATYMQGDYKSPTFEPMARGAAKFFFTPSFDISASTNVFKLGNKGKDEFGYATLDMNLEFLILPEDTFSPYVFAGTGVGFNADFENVHSKVQFGAGVEYLVTSHFGVKLYGEYNVNFTDNLDYKISGVRDDYYWRFGLGMTYYFPKGYKYKKK
ncbi:curli production assembly/transport component CsgG [Flavobacterium cutihirudinis]|uniref:Curli production assembly/transport component CsgG n=1 Tax=Flavobacterium cutihirudinis TaxID=1265740 RepID=A0A3D9FZG3_9FLAO|nr:CsgG/HfaB family protein [Flavobacterium cutihirudinis]RED26365.1 curli production assembly/transport component CsgG [Flavobacterium cutihirudinis]